MYQEKSGKEVVKKHAQQYEQLPQSVKDRYELLAQNHANWKEWQNSWEVQTAWDKVHENRDAARSLKEGAFDDSQQAVFSKCKFTTKDLEYMATWFGSSAFSDRKVQGMREKAQQGPTHQCCDTQSLVDCASPATA